MIYGCTAKMVSEPAYDYSGMDKLSKNAHKRIEKFIRDTQKEDYPYTVSPATRIDSLKVDKPAKTLEVFFNKAFSFAPFRTENVTAFYAGMKKRLGRKFRKYTFTAYSLRELIEELIPNFYRKDQSEYDLKRMPDIKQGRSKPIVRNNSHPWLPTNGLFNRNIVLWHSHGFYYNIDKDRWMWQRARLFQTVEDLLPLSFTTPYLIPMLENAGARLFLPRERDTQLNEAIVDNDSPQTDSTEINYVELASDSLLVWTHGYSIGFAIGNLPYPFNYNPFLQGTYRKVHSDTAETAQIEWIPNIPETGNYAVHISFASIEEGITDAKYKVHHLGGITDFSVNQTIGGGTWIYLGRFKFKQGFHPDSGKVVLTNQSEQPGKWVTADAVRFGGGMGIIERGGRTSGRPRFMEGARYYLQFAGMPDTLVYDLHDSKDDYKDDYKSRAEYANYLRGAPFGPNKKREIKGLGIPIDLSLAFHTDAGIVGNDSTIGTLSIYSIEDADTVFVFPDGVSRVANRDLADLIQTQLVSDLRSKYDLTWNRRALLDAQYSEAFRPNVPSMLLELLSHQNFMDMKFALDPRFRFDASRSIYKGILKFLAFQNRYDYVVQPLPITHFYAEFTDSAEVTLQWRGVTDPLELTADPLQYIVYRRINEGGFDNGILVDHPEIVFKELQRGEIYSFKVTAVNQGGESFPSEVLSICWLGSDYPTSLIINGFDRISGPATFETSESVGFLNFLDNGVPDKYDLNFTGSQFDFFLNSEYRSDDAPGHGASSADYETRIVPGNSFDYPFVHGKSMLANNRSFVSVSDEAVMDSLVDLSDYGFVDLILGEERETHWPKAYGDTLLGTQFKTFPESLQKKIKYYCQNGGSLFISGAYVATDLFENKPDDHPDVKFGREILKLNWAANHAARTGGVFSSDSLFLPIRESFRFNTTYDPQIYTVESPDAIDPVKESKTILRYSENNFSAAIGYIGLYNLVVFGFPFETINSEEDRMIVMEAVLNYLNGKNGLKLNE